MTELDVRCPFVSRRSLAAVGGVAHLRDSRGRSRTPGLVPTRRFGDIGVLAVGSFKFVQRYMVTPEQGWRFCEATGDTNEIHRTEDIVPGAYTSARIMLPLEILFPRFAPEGLSVKFTEVARYNCPIRIVSDWTPVENGRVRVETTAYQRGRTVASARISGILRDSVTLPNIKRRKMNMDALRTIRSFFTALDVQANPYFKKAEGEDYTYPFAYISSLPSGEMVRSYDADGGFLTKLTFEFGGEGKKIPLTATERPEVALEAPAKRPRSAFQRIFTKIKAGLTTYYKGSALVTKPT